MCVAPGSRKTKYIKNKTKKKSVDKPFTLDYQNTAESHCDQCMHVLGFLSGSVG